LKDLVLNTGGFIKGNKELVFELESLSTSLFKIEAPLPNNPFLR
jgi:hypothetical protein